MAINIFRDTTSMIAAIDRVKTPAKFLTDTFFPNVLPCAVTPTVNVEIRRGRRILAPFVTDEGNSVNMEREIAYMRTVTPALMAPSRVVTGYDVKGRAFGEALLGENTAAERAAELQARDFIDLQSAIQNRKEAMAAELLTTGKITISAFAGDGKVAKGDEIDLTSIWNQKKAKANWAKASAGILKDLETASRSIRSNAGEVPTVAVVGENVKQYIMSNEEIMRYLMVPSRENLLVASIQPHLVSPAVGYVGRILPLNLDIYEYVEDYIDDTGAVKSFLGANDVIMAIPGKGKQLNGAVNLVNENGEFQTYANAIVPKYLADEKHNILQLIMYSRGIVIPETCDDWYYIDAGN